MSKITPFLWLDNEAEEAANFYLSVFPDARKVEEMRSSGVGPWPAGELATITIQLLGQSVTLMNGGPGHPLTDAFSFSLACKDQDEIDHYWAKLSDGGQEIQCGWLKDKFGLCWQVVPENIVELVSTPMGFQAMLSMVKLDIGKLEAAAK